MTVKAWSLFSHGFAESETYRPFSFFVRRFGSVLDAVKGSNYSKLLSLFVGESVMAQFENCEAENSKLDGKEDGGEELEMVIKGDVNDGEDDVIGDGKFTEWPRSEPQLNKIRCCGTSGEKEPRKAPLETLEGHSLVQSPKNKQMKGLLVVSAALDGNESMEEIKGPHKELTSSGTAKEVQPKIKSEFQFSERCTPPSELLPSSRSITSATNLTLKNKKVFQPKNNGDYKPGLNLQNAPDLRIGSAFATVKIPASDGYNWRKYGQKEVKSPKGFRSYYRCSNTECCAKKIECSDHLGCMTEIVYKSEHCHDPPMKINNTRQSKRPSSSEATHYNVGAVHSRTRLGDFNLTTSSKEPRAETPSTSEGKQQMTRNDDEIVETSIKEEHDNGSEPKQRMKEREMEYSDSLKAGKKHKFLVEAVCEEGTFSDGYRWRKYGQKMVKGNPHPRNYYRCTSAGCPVRKHTITAIDNPCTITMAYKGTHDHEIPVPRKRSSIPPIASIAPMKDSKLKNTELCPSQMSQVQVDKEKELIDETLDLRGEKAMESARTLLSIGFEIKQC